jgi:hypothetical protein
MRFRSLAFDYHAEATNLLCLEQREDSTPTIWIAPLPPDRSIALESGNDNSDNETGDFEFMAISTDDALVSPGSEGTSPCPTIPGESSSLAHNEVEAASSTPTCTGRDVNYLPPVASPKKETAMEMKCLDPGSNDACPPETMKTPWPKKARPTLPIVTDKKATRRQRRGNDLFDDVDDGEVDHNEDFLFADGATDDGATVTPAMTEEQDPMVSSSNNGFKIGRPAILTLCCCSEQKIDASERTGDEKYKDHDKNDDAAEGSTTGDVDMVATAGYSEPFVPSELVNAKQAVRVSTMQRAQPAAFFGVSTLPPESVAFGLIRHIKNERLKACPTFQSALAIALAPNSSSAAPSLVSGQVRHLIVSVIRACHPTVPRLMLSNLRQLMVVSLSGPQGDLTERLMGSQCLFDGNVGSIVTKATATSPTPPLDAHTGAIVPYLNRTCLIGAKQPVFFSAEVFAVASLCAKRQQQRPASTGASIEVLKEAKEPHLTVDNTYCGPNKRRKLEPRVDTTQPSRGTNDSHLSPGTQQQLSTIKARTPSSSDAETNGSSRQGKANCDTHHMHSPTLLRSDQSPYLDSKTYDFSQNKVKLSKAFGRSSMRDKVSLPDKDFVNLLLGKNQKNDMEVAAPVKGDAGDSSVSKTRAHGCDVSDVSEIVQGRVSDMLDGSWQKICATRPDGGEDDASEGITDFFETNSMGKQVLRPLETTNSPTGLQERASDIKRSMMAESRHCNTALKSSFHEGPTASEYEAVALKFPPPQFLRGYHQDARQESHEVESRHGHPDSECQARADVRGAIARTKVSTTGAQGRAKRSYDAHGKGKRGALSLVPAAASRGAASPAPAASPVHASDSAGNEYFVLSAGGTHGLVEPFRGAAAKHEIKLSEKEACRAEKRKRKRERKTRKKAKKERKRELMKGQKTSKLSAFSDDNVANGDEIVCIGVRTPPGTNLASSPKQKNSEARSVMENSVHFEQVKVAKFFTEKESPGSADPRGLHRRASATETTEAPGGNAVQPQKGCHSSTAKATEMYPGKDAPEPTGQPWWSRSSLSVLHTSSFTNDLNCMSQSRQSGEPTPNSGGDNGNSQVGLTQATETENRQVLERTPPQYQNRFSTMPPLELLCAENFVESWGEIVAELATGRWTHSFFGGANRKLKCPLPDSVVTGRKITFRDTPLVDSRGVDIELPGGHAIVVQSISKWSVDAPAARGFLESILRLVSMNRYGCLTLVFCIEVDISQEQSRRVLQLMKAFTGDFCPIVVQVHITSLVSLSCCVARIILKDVNSQNTDLSRYNDAVKLLADHEVEVPRRAAFLLSCIPTLSVVNCAHILSGCGENENPLDQFHLLLRSQIERQQVARRWGSSTDGKRVDKAMLQLSYIFRASLTPTSIS